MSIQAHYFYFTEDFIINNKNQKGPQFVVNEQISVKELRVVSADGDQLGIMSRREALDKADELGLDLVLIAATANPPVARIIDYNKYKFEVSKKQKEIKKNQKITELKELRFSLTIDIGDINIKVKKAKEFIEDGNKVKFSIKLRGRENEHPELAVEKLNSMYESLKEISQLELKPNQEGRFINMIIAPLPTKK